MFNTITTNPYKAQPATTPFRWGWDFNHWVPCMLHCPLHPHRKSRPMYKLNPTKPPSSLNESITSSNRLRIFCKSPMPSTRSSMINAGCHMIFRWAIKFGCNCRKNSIHDPIKIFIHFAMDLTPSPRMWVTIILSSTFPHSLACTPCLMWTSLCHTFHPY
jgi:hypothetical protein